MPEICEALRRTQCLANVETDDMPKKKTAIFERVGTRVGFIVDLFKDSDRPCRSFPLGLRKPPFCTAAFGSCNLTIFAQMAKEKDPEIGAVVALLTYLGYFFLIMVS